jgi:hypothetical protein
MLPGNVASSISVPGRVLAPDNIGSSLFVDFERGGLAITDASLGLDYQDWQCKYNPSTGHVFINPVGDADALYVTIPGASEMAFAFDQSMRPVLAYMVGAVGRLRWYDTTVSSFATTEFTGIRSPRLTLDDKRPSQLGSSDIIFAYIKANGDLCYRQQRDRYETERVLHTGVDPSMRLVAAGMAANLRLHFEIA